MHAFAGVSPRCEARIAGVFYLVTFVAGVVALVSVTNRFVANFVATGAYIAVTMLFFDLFRPVDRQLSLIAALVSLAGLIVGALNMFRVAPFELSPLVFFGFYCVLIGYLIYRSTFLPSALGVLMAFGGLGWLTFMSSLLVRYLAPYNLAPGIFAEGVLTVWLLVFGVNTERWNEQARAA